MILNKYGGGWEQITWTRCWERDATNQLGALWERDTDLRTMETRRNQRSAQHGGQEMETTAQHHVQEMETGVGWRPADGDRRDEAATHDGHEISAPSIWRDTGAVQAERRDSWTVEGCGPPFLFYQAQMPNHWRYKIISLAICFSHLPKPKIWQVQFGKPLEMLLVDHVYTMALLLLQHTSTFFASDINLLSALVRRSGGEGSVPF